MKSKEIMNQDGIDRALKRIAHQILEHNKGTLNLAVIGIRTRGVTIAERLCRIITSIEGTDVPMGSLDITLYRDDFSSGYIQPNVKKTEINFPLKEKNIVLIDDVLFTGRTIRAAIDCIMDFGRPRFIRLAVLIDRGHRELPIKPDFVGKNIPTSMEEKVRVFLDENDGEDRVLVFA